MAVGGIIGSIAAVLGVLKCLGIGLRDVLRRCGGPQPQPTVQDGEQPVNNGGGNNSNDGGGVQNIGHGNVTHNTSIYISAADSRDLTS